MRDLTYIEHTNYPSVRLAMADYGIDQSDAQIEEQLLRMFSEADPEDVESFMRGFRNIGKQLAPIAKTVTPVVQKALPGAIQGAVKGGMVAGPWGAVAGAVGGGALSALSPQQPGGGGQPVARPRPPQTTHPIPTVPTVRQPQVVGAPRVAGNGLSPPIVQLLALLSRPETIQALQALLLGQSGRQTVRVGARHVPTTAFANAIAELAAEAVDATNIVDDTDYLTENGYHRCDPGSRAEQASLLLTDIAAVIDEEEYELETPADDLRYLYDDAAYA